MTKDIREVGVSSIEVIDDWCSLEELQYLIWAFEHDGETKKLWEAVRQGDRHFPRQLSAYVYDRTCKSTQLVYLFRDKLSEEAQKFYNYPHLFGGQSMLEGVVDSSFVDGMTPQWQHYEVILFLNDDYEGGEIYFPEKDIIVTPRAGSVLMFPAKERWSAKEVKGTAYKMRLKLTDLPEHREDDPDYAKVPFQMRKSSKTTDIPAKKKKGCGSCADKRKKEGKAPKGKVRVEIYNPLTKTTKVVFKDKNDASLPKTMRTKKGKRQGKSGLII